MIGKIVIFANLSVSLSSLTFSLFKPTVISDTCIHDYLPYQPLLGPKRHLQLAESGSTQAVSVTRCLPNRFYVYSDDSDDSSYISSNYRPTPESDQEEIDLNSIYGFSFN